VVRIGFGFRHPDEAVLPIPNDRHFIGVRAAASWCGYSVRVGDLARLGKEVSELSHAPFAEVLGPLGFDFRDKGVPRRPATG
jgi:hypothetical protein